MESKAVETIVTSVIKEITAAMGVESEVTVWEDEQGMHVDIWGDDVGLLIGRKGSTLEAIQVLCAASLRHGGALRPRIILDIEHYKKKRREKLTERALKLADRVKGTERSLKMDPMSAEERKVVHEALKDDPHVETWSEGDEPERRVVISPA